MGNYKVALTACPETMTHITNKIQKRAAPARVFSYFYMTLTLIDQ